MTRHDSTKVSRYLATHTPLPLLSCRRQSKPCLVTALIMFGSRAAFTGRPSSPAMRQTNQRAGSKAELPGLHPSGREPSMSKAAACRRLHRCQQYGPFGTRCRKACRLLKGIPAFDKPSHGKI